MGGKGREGDFERARGGLLPYRPMKIDATCAYQRPRMSTIPPLPDGEEDPSHCQTEREGTNHATCEAMMYKSPWPRHCGAVASAASLAQ